LEPKEQQGEQPQERPEEVGQDLESLPECPNHQPSSFIAGKPQNIISLLSIFTKVIELIVYMY
jgi:hypothetical protein